MDARELLVYLRTRGVDLALASGGDLSYDAPQGLLTPDLLAELRRFKPQILALLKSEPTRQRLAADPASAGVSPASPQVSDAPSPARAGQEPAQGCAMAQSTDRYPQTGEEFHRRLVESLAALHGSTWEAKVEHHKSLGKLTQREAEVSAFLALVEEESAAPSRPGSIGGELMKISDIVIGPRHRKDMGDLESLAASMKEVRLLHPIVVSPENELLAGERRLAAAKLLEWTEIAVTVAPNLDSVVSKLIAERDENTCRKDLAPSEAVGLANALEPMEKEAAEHRMKAGGPSENFSRGRAKDKVGKAVGLSRPTLEKAREVVESGDEDLIAEMDRTGRVSGVHDKLLAKKQAPSEPPAPSSNEKPPPVLDETRAIVPPKCKLRASIVDAFARRDEFKEYMNLISKLKCDIVKKAKEDPLFGRVHHQQWTMDCDSLRAKLKFARPHAICPYCHGEGKPGKGCEPCQQQGWVGEQTYKFAPKDGK